MKPRISVLTLGVTNLEKSVRFYKDGLGLTTEGIIGKEFEYGAVAFFQLQNGLMLALWPFKSIARDTNLTEATAGSPAFTIAHNVQCKEQVEIVMNQAKNAGAAIIKPPQGTFYGGYAGYFRDIDGHLWEIAWNPAFRIED